MASYMMTTSSPQMDRNRFKIAVVCALSLEAEMVQATFERNWTNDGIKCGKAPGDGNAYTIGTIGDHNIVLTHLAEMGGNNAAATAAGLRSSFRRIEVVFLVGLCGAAPIHPETKEEVILGDCIISTAMIQYDFGRQLPDGFSRKRGLEDCLSRPIPEVRAMIARLKIPQNCNHLTERLAFHLGNLRQMHHIEYPGPRLDRLYNPAYPHKHHDGDIACRKCSEDDGSCSLDCITLKCSTSELVHRSRLDNNHQPWDQRPKVHFGRIGSANSVMKAGTTRDNLAKIDKIVGFEMEGAGLWDVFPTILVKSVCDYADSHKNKGWQRYAAASSAACLKALFEQWEVSESSPTGAPVPFMPWMEYTQPPNATSILAPKEPNQWNSNNQTRMNSLQSLSHQHVTSSYQSMFANPPIGYENPPVAMLTNTLNQQPKSLTDQLNEIDAVLNSPAYEDPLTHNSSVRLESTCDWILERTIYREWLHSTSPQTTPFLWLHAGAGSGKTILCTSIVLSLKNDPYLNVFPYFSSAHVQPRTDLSSIVRYWIAETARRDQGMLGLIHKALYKDGRGRIISAADVWILFGHVLTYLRGCVLVLDGLDEYDVASRQEFLIKLKSQLAWKGVKVLITSRDESDIRIELASSSASTPGLSFSSYRIGRSDTQSDINLLSNNIIDLKLPRQDTFFRSKLATSLAERSDGMFLWVKLASQRLNAGQSQAALGRIVDKAPAGLNSVYGHKWQTIMQQPEEEEKLRAIAILRWCTYAMTPLTIAQLAEALAISLTDDREEFDRQELPDEIDEDFINYGIKGLCGSFVELRADNFDQALSEHTIHLIHSSVKDFLLEVLPEKGAQRSSVPAEVIESAQHLELSKICLRYLCYRNMVAGSNHKKGLPCKFREYALDHWYEHQAISQVKDSEFTQLVLKFFDGRNENFIDWSCEDTAPNDYHKKFEYDRALPYYYAAEFGLTSVLIEMHLRMTHSVNSIGGLYGTALQAACARGHQATFDLLLSWGADPNLEAGLYGTALSASVIHDRPEMTEKLLNHGANPRQKNRNDHTALFLGAGWNSLECIGVLLEKDSDILNSFEGQQITPLMNAAEAGHYDVVKLLLNHGADTAALDCDRWTCLHFVARSNRTNMVEILLEHGADPRALTSGSDMPVHLAIRYASVKTVALLFEKSGSDIHRYATVDGRTLLHYAAQRGDTEIYNYFIGQNLDTKLKDIHGKGILEYCCMSGSKELLRKILRTDGMQIDDTQMDDTNSTNIGSTCLWSPLHWVCRNGSFDMIKLLDAVGIIFFPIKTLWPEAAWAPLDIARFYGNLNLVTSDGKLNNKHPWESVRNCGIVEMDTSTNSIIGVFKNSNEHIPRANDRFCDGCRSDIVGPRFICLDCVEYDYCFMCKYSAEQKGLHFGHGWKCIEPADEPKSAEEST